MTARIFAYKGNLGATTDLTNGKFINNPLDHGQLGCVIHSSEVEITPDAKQLLKKAGREGGSFASIMLTEHADGSGSSIGLLGFGKHNFGKNIKIGRICELSVIDHFNEVEFEVPQDYKEFIDSKKD